MEQASDPTRGVRRQCKMRSPLGVILLLALVACATVPAHGPTAPTGAHAAALDVESKTVALVSTNARSVIKAYCSGVWIGPELILTAAHCVDDTPIGEVVEYATRGDLDAGNTEATRTHIGILAMRSEMHDLALVRAPFGPAHAVAPIANADPKQGQPVQTMGHPLGLWYSYSTGVVSAVRFERDTWWVQTTAPVSPGNSGGGLFDSRGALLGICHGGFPRGQLLNVYVHATHLRAFVSGIT